MPVEKRQLAAILFADIAGFTALMQENESAAAKLLVKFQQTIKEQTADNRGKIINFYGDGCLVIFNSPVDAVRCAGALQIIFQKNPKVPVRIGLHAGDVVFRDGNIYGDSVNLTSRIESIGVEGSVLFSESIKNAIESHDQFIISALGKFHFKNIKKSIPVYALANPEFTVPKKSQIKGKLNPRKLTFIQQIANNAKGAIAVFGMLGLLVALNFGQLKTALQNMLGETSLKDKKVAVMFFENETGEENLNGVGKMAADWITQQLMEIKNTKVVLPSNVRNNMHLAAASLEGVQRFAQATGAEVIINGRYYQSGSNLILQAQVVKVQSGEVIHSLNQPIIGDKADPLPLIQEVSQRITGYWAVQDRKQFTEQPPKLDAYQAYLEGRKYWGIDFQKVDEYYLNAYQIDSNFMVPLVELVASKIDESEYFLADSLLNFVLQKSDRLSKAHQLEAKAYEAELKGDLTASVHFWEQIYEFDAKEFSTVTNLSRQYLNTNQVQKALAILQQYDPSFLDFQECIPCQEYYELLTFAHFQNGDFQKIIDLVEGFDFDIKEGLIANYYLKSLVHVGNFDLAYEKLGLHLGQDLTFNGGRQSAGLLLVGMLFEMEKLNQTDVMKIMSNLLVNYGEDNEEDWLSDYYIGIGLYGKGKYDEAKDYFHAFYNRFKEVPMVIDLGLSSLAACHIQLKENEALDNIYESLSNYDHPFATSFVTYTKAKIEAQLGHNQKAISLLQKSKLEGQAFLWFKFQNDPLLMPLFEEPAFKTLVKVN